MEGDLSDHFFYFFIYFHSFHILLSLFIIFYYFQRRNYSNSFLVIFSKSLLKVYWYIDVIEDYVIEYNTFMATSIYLFSS